jgi:hypothetical protein
MAHCLSTRYGPISNSNCSTRWRLSRNLLLGGVAISDTITGVLNSKITLRSALTSFYPSSCSEASAHHSLHCCTKGLIWQNSLCHCQQISACKGHHRAYPPLCWCRWCRLPTQATKTRKIDESLVVSTTLSAAGEGNTQASLRPHRIETYTDPDSLWQSCVTLYWLIMHSTC